MTNLQSGLADLGEQPQGGKTKLTEVNRHETPLPERRHVRKRSACERLPEGCNNGVYVPLRQDDVQQNYSFLRLRIKEKVLGNWRIGGRAETALAATFPDATHMIEFIRVREWLL